MSWWKKLLVILGILREIDTWPKKEPPRTEGLLMPEDEPDEVESERDEKAWEILRPEAKPKYPPLPPYLPSHILIHKAGILFKPRVKNSHGVVEGRVVIGRPEWWPRRHYAEVFFCPDWEGKGVRLHMTASDTPYAGRPKWYFHQWEKYLKGRKNFYLHFIDRGAGAHFVMLIRAANMRQE